MFVSIFNLKNNLIASATQPVPFAAKRGHEQFLRKVNIVLNENIIFTPTKIRKFSVYVS